MKEFHLNRDGLGPLKVPNPRQFDKLRRILGDRDLYANTEGHLVEIQSRDYFLIKTHSKWKLAFPYVHPLSKAAIIKDERKLCMACDPGLRAMFTTYDGEEFVSYGQSGKTILKGPSLGSFRRPSPLINSKVNYPNGPSPSTTMKKRD